MIAGVPYDAKIEYLESSGTQYIDTEISPTLDTELECIVIPIDHQISVVQTDFISRRGINITDWAVGSWACYFGDKGYIPEQGSSRFKYFTPQRILINSQKVTIDDIEYTINATSMTGDRLYVYKSVWSYETDKTRICALSIRQNGALVRDYIPVRVGQVGYMYDRVSRKLFGNAGTGSFVLGPDVATPVMGLRRYPQIGGAA